MVRRMSSPISFLAATLKSERKKANLTQLQLAELTGLGLKTIRKIEQDDQNVLISNVNYLLNFFGFEMGPRELVTSPVNKVKKLLSRDEVLKILASLLPIFKIKYGIRALGLFGSFARNEGSNSSDIDILFEGTTNLSNEGHMTLILEHLLGGYNIDFTNNANIDPRLKEEILGSVIYV